MGTLSCSQTWYPAHVMSAVSQQYSIMQTHLALLQAKCTALTVSVTVCRLAIACYLVFLGECDANAAIQRVRKGRPGALQTHQQEHFVQIFQMYLVHLRCAESHQLACCATLMQRLHCHRNQMDGLAVHKLPYSCFVSQDFYLISMACNVACHAQALGVPLVA